MKLTGILLALGLGLSGSAVASCHDECALPNPISGGCGKYVKICDIGNPGRAVASLGNDINDAKNHIIAVWHDVYGEVPASLRYALDTYPISIAVAIYPETAGYTLAVAAIETLVHNSKARAEAAAPIIQAAPEWKKVIIAAAERFLLNTDTQAVNITNWNDPGAQPLRDRFAVPHANFLVCIDHAPDENTGHACYTKLIQESAPLIN